MTEKTLLAIGQTWRCRNGDVCKITEMTPAHNIWNISHPFWGKCSDGDGHSYTAEGRASANPERDHPHDLIELLSPAPLPADEGGVMTTAVQEVIEALINFDEVQGQVIGAKDFLRAFSVNARANKDTSPTASDLKDLLLDYRGVYVEEQAIIQAARDLGIPVYGDTRVGVSLRNYKALKSIVDCRRLKP